MMIRDMFADDINRKINGVIKVDQAADAEYLRDFIQTI